MKASLNWFIFYLGVHVIGVFLGLTFINATDAGDTMTNIHADRKASLSD